MDSVRFQPGLIVLLVVAVGGALCISIGCEPLHREMDQQLPDDAGIGGEPDASDVDDNNDEECVPGQPCGPCEEGETVCVDDQTQCEGAVDLNSDDQNCGSCGQICESPAGDATASCEQGSCEISCDDPQHTWCEQTEECSDLSSDDQNCGSCGQICESPAGDATASCEQGICEISCDDAQYTWCEQAEVCADLDSDVEHCGQCSAPCTTDSQEDDVQCVDGQCECGDELELCDDECVDTQTEHSHCGFCNNACPGPQDCVEGECTN